MNKLTVVENEEELKIEKIFETLKNEELSKLKLIEIDKHFKSLSEDDRKRLSKKFINHYNNSIKNLEIDRLEKSNQLKQKYEKVAKKIFNNMSNFVIGEIYEVSMCLDEELTSGIYFLRNKTNGLIKIGYSKNIKKRIKQIENAFKFIGYDDELKLEAIHLCFNNHLSLAELFFHNEFKNQRVKGEWFDVNNDTLEDFFLSTDFQGEFIKGVLVSLTDYESSYFEPLEKDFNINLKEMEYELYHEILTGNNFDTLLRHKVRNKLFRTIRAVEKNKIGILVLDLNLSELPVKRVGITTEYAINCFDFQELKEYKYDQERITKIINSIV